MKKIEMKGFSRRATILLVALVVWIGIPVGVKLAEHFSAKSCSTPDIYIGDFVNLRYNKDYAEIKAKVEALNRDEPISREDVVRLLDLGEVISVDEHHVRVRLKNGSEAFIGNYTVRFDNNYSIRFNNNGRMWVYNDVGVKKVMDFRDASASASLTGLSLFGKDEMSIEALAAIKSSVKSMNSYDSLDPSCMAGHPVNGWTSFYDGYMFFLSIVFGIILLALMFYFIVMIFG